MNTQNKWLIVYSSISGNTKQIADAMAEAFGTEADIYSIKDKFSIDDYAYIALGYWVTRGGPPKDMQDLMGTISGKTVALFQTHGAEVGSEHAVTSFARAATYLGPDNLILSTFSSQGRINPNLLARRTDSNPNDPHAATERNRQRWASAAQHPNAEDFERAKNFVAGLKHKLELRRKYLERKQTNN